MIGHISGFYRDNRPIIKCRLAAAGGFDTNNCGGIELLALIDTGCTDFMITPEIVTKLSLSPSGHVTNFTAGGPVNSAYYGVEAGFDLTTNENQILRLKVEVAKACELPPSEHHDIVIGMGTLKCFNMIFNPNFGQFRLEYDSQVPTEN